MYFNCLPKQKLKDIHKEYKKYLEYTVEFLVSTHNYQPKESRKYNQWRKYLINRSRNTQMTELLDWEVKSYYNYLTFWEGWGNIEDFMKKH